MRRFRFGIWLAGFSACSIVACGLDSGSIVGENASNGDSNGGDGSVSAGSDGSGATGDGSSTTGSDSGDAASTSGDSGSDAGGPPPELIYGNTSTDLYEIDPAARTATHLGAFSGCGSPVFVNDIAVDSAGTIYAIVRSDTTTSGSGLYTVARNGACTLVHTLSDANHEQGVSFTAGGVLLAARDDNKDLVSVNTTSGAESSVRGNAFPDVPVNDLVCNSTICWGTFPGSNCGATGDNACTYSFATNGTNATQLGIAAPGDAVGLAYANGKMYAVDTNGPIWEITIGTPPSAVQISVTGAPTSGWSGAASSPSFP